MRNGAWLRQGCGQLVEMSKHMLKLQGAACSVLDNTHVTQVVMAQKAASCWH